MLILLLLILVLVLCCFLLSDDMVVDGATSTDDLDVDALEAGRERGSDGWSSTPALLYTRHRDISP